MVPKAASRPAGWRGDGLGEWQAELRARLPGGDQDEASAESEAPAADQQLIGRENLAAAARVIRALPPRTRDAFLLHRFEDQTYAQIAKRLGVSVSMVEKHIAEALRQLKISRDG